MGEVFAAENIRTGRPVAVKLLRADSKSKASAVARFRREARAAGSINSDHVTQVLDVEDDAEHGIVIVFELLEGESLIDRLKRTGPIPFDELHPIIEEVWVGLSDAHKVGIIHRDLKPSNVFLEQRPDGQRRVKILDFGISKLPKEMGGETLTEMGQSLGTFSFMPPEQIGRAKTVDHRADIYATTTMIYQSLTGLLPYVARNILVMVELKSKTDPRPLSEAMGHPIDRAVEEFVARGLARNPADRFQNALLALEEWRKLKTVDVPMSRRAVSMDMASHGRGGSSTPSGPLPAAGRIPTGAFGPVRSPMPSSSYLPPMSSNPASGIVPPAPVVPAAMLEPVMPASSMPRLYDHTESTTDHSRDGSRGEAAQPGATQAGGVKSTMPSAGALVQRANDPQLDMDGSGERKGPQGTRMMPQTVVQQAVAYAAAKNAAQGGSPHQTMPQGQPMGGAQALGQPQPTSRHSSQPDLRGLAQQIPPSSGAHPAAGSSAPPPPQSPHMMAGQVPASAQHRGQSPVPGQQQMHGQQPSSIPPGSGIHPSARLLGQADGRAQQPSHSPSTMPPAHPSTPPPPQRNQLSTVRLPDDPTSNPASQEKTQVYRPKSRPPQKKQSLALFVLGAIAFAVVGFGIVYLVQLLVRMAH